MGDLTRKLLADGGGQQQGSLIRNLLGSTDSEMTVGEPQVLKYGALEAPTLDLNNRPRVQNADGSISTVRSMGVNMDGKEYLIPTVSDDGRVMSDEEAIEAFRNGGKHLGVYGSPEASDSAAQRIHEDQARRYAPELSMFERILGIPGQIAQTYNEGGLTGLYNRATRAPAGLPESGPNPGEILLGGNLRAAAGAGKLARLGLAAANTGIDAAVSGVTGAAQGFDDSDEETMLGRIVDAGRAGLRSATTAGGVSAALGLGGKVGELAGQGLEAAARKAKNTVAGSNAREADAILKKYGAEADTDMLGQLLDKYSPSGVFSPKSAAGHLGDVAPQLQVQGQRVRDMINKAGYDEGVNDLVPDAFGRFQSNVDDRALEAMRRPAGGEQQDFARAMADKADEVHAMPPPADLAEFVNDKSGFQASGARKGAVGHAETARDLADQAVGGEAKDMVAELMGQAEPGTFARWDNARQQTHELSMLQEVLQAKKAGESTAGDIGSTIGSGVIGAGLGAIAGGVAADNPAAGAGAGATAALAGAFGLGGGATRTAIRQVGGTGLADLGANVSRSLGRGANALGGLARNGAPGLAMGAGNAASSRSMQGQTRGHELPNVVRHALQNNPELLAPFAQQLADADMRGELREELLRLGDNPEFRALQTKLTGSR